MPALRKNLLLVALYAAAGLLLAWLAFLELGHDRFEDCMSLHAFTRAQCEEYARE